MALSTDAIIYHPPAEPKPICFAAIFGNDRPVELEIGSGKGGFLLEQSRAHEDRNFVGVEWANRYFKFAADRMARWGLCNVRVVRADAKEFVTRFLPESSITALHVYHPDPWPKRRHHKRRLIDRVFVDAAARALVDHGRWMVQTDHAEYFEVIRTLLSGHPKLEQTLGGFQNDHGHEAIVVTNYQIKYRRKGRKIHTLTCTRLPRVRENRPPLRGA